MELGKDAEGSGIELLDRPLGHTSEAPSDPHEQPPQLCAPPPPSWGPRASSAWNQDSCPRVSPALETQQWLALWGSEATDGLHPGHWEPQSLSHFICPPQQLFCPLP